MRVLRSVIAPAFMATRQPELTGGRAVGSKIVGHKLVLVRVFLYHPQKLLRVRKLGLRHRLIGVWTVSFIHGQWFKGEPNGTIELNQRGFCTLTWP